LSERLILPENVPDDLLLPLFGKVEKNVNCFKPVISTNYDYLALPSKTYPYPIHSNGDHDYAFNNPCPNEKNITKKQKAEYKKLLSKEICQFRP